MDVDKFVKEYQSDLAPPAPTIAPNTSLHRAVPIRAPAVGSDVGVPFLLALASAIVTFASVGIIALALSWSIGVPGVAAGVVLAVVWFWRLKNWESLLWATERITGVDINRDGEIGEPGPSRRTVQLEISSPDEPGSIRYLNIPDPLFAKLPGVALKLSAGTPFSEAAMTGKGRPLSRSEFHQLRDLFMGRGVVAWKDERHPTLGIEFTSYGKRVIRQMAELADSTADSTTPLRMRTPRGTKSLPAQSNRGAGEEWDDE